MLIISRLRNNRLARQPNCCSLFHFDGSTGIFPKTLPPGWRPTSRKLNFCRSRGQSCVYVNHLFRQKAQNEWSQASGFRTSCAVKVFRQTGHFNESSLSLPTDPVRFPFLPLPLVLVVSPLSSTFWADAIIYFTTLKLPSLILFVLQTMRTKCRVFSVFAPTIEISQSQPQTHSSFATPELVWQRLRLH
jgi:hypothetical protein